MAKAVENFCPPSPLQTPRKENRIYHQKTTKFQTQSTYRRSIHQDPLQTKDQQISEGDIFYNKALDSNIIATRNSSKLNFKFLDKISEADALIFDQTFKHGGENFRLGTLKGGNFNLEPGLEISDYTFTVSADLNKITIADKNFQNFEFIRKALVQQIHQQFESELVKITPKMIFFEDDLGFGNSGRRGSQVYEGG
jgi:hypothetical protein